MINAKDPAGGAGKDPFARRTIPSTVPARDGKMLHRDRERPPTFNDEEKRSQELLRKGDGITATCQMA